jgi:hypothetical protein
MQPELPTIHMFWHGAPLSRVERVCLASFRENGHTVDLYVYQEPLAVPSGIRLRDAAEILPLSSLFRHRRSQSLALFADWFRYRLLLERGGIWADTDVICLQPLDYPGKEIYGWQDDKTINNAVLGLPPGHELAQWLAACCENPNRLLPYDSFGMRVRKLRRRFLQGDRRSNVRWGEYGPKGLTAAARHFGYAQKALPPRHFYPVPCDDWHVLFESGTTRPPPSLEDSHAVHLWNERIGRTPGFDKIGRFPEDSPYEQLCRRFIKNDV